jgi:hypothetical protein
MWTLLKIVLNQRLDDFHLPGIYHVAPTAAKKRARRLERFGCRLAKTPRSVTLCAIFPALKKLDPLT